MKSEPTLAHISEVGKDIDFSKFTIDWSVEGDFLVARKNGEVFYDIGKDTCKTRKQRFKWICHISGKQTMDRYAFMKAFIKALDTWGIYECYIDSKIVK